MLLTHYTPSSTSQEPALASSDDQLILYADTLRIVEELETLMSGVGFINLCYQAKGSDSLLPVFKIKFAEWDAINKQLTAKPWDIIVANNRTRYHYHIQKLLVFTNGNRIQFCCLDELLGKSNSNVWNCRFMGIYDENLPETIHIKFCKLAIKVISNPNKKHHVTLNIHAINHENAMAMLLYDDTTGLGRTLLGHRTVFKNISAPPTNRYYFFYPKAKGDSLNKIIKQKLLDGLSAEKRLMICLNIFITIHQIIMTKKIIPQDVKPQDLFIDLATDEITLVDPGGFVTMDETNFAGCTRLYCAPEALDKIVKNKEKNLAFMLGIIFKMIFGADNPERQFTPDGRFYFHDDTGLLDPALISGLSVSVINMLGKLFSDMMAEDQNMRCDLYSINSRLLEVYKVLLSEMLPAPKIVVSSLSKTYRLL